MRRNEIPLIRRERVEVEANAGCSNAMAFSQFVLGPSPCPPKLFENRRRRLRSNLMVCGRRQVEIVYDPDERINKLADKVELSRLSLFSPCKINVFLRITNKRDDGFHDLASLFHVISLGDVIKFSLSPSKSKDRLSTNVSGVPLDDRNLIIKALNLYRKKTGTHNFFWVGTHHALCC